MPAKEVFVWERQNWDELFVYDHTFSPPREEKSVQLAKDEVKQFCKEHGLTYRKLKEASDNDSFHVIAPNVKAQVVFKLRFNVAPPLRWQWQRWYKGGRFFGG